MRRFNHYVIEDWLMLRPLKHSFKTLRNDCWQYYYLQQKKGNETAFIDQIQGADHLCIVIAFEQPWALNWLLTMAKINAPHLTFLVFDNSRSELKKNDIAQVCRIQAISYFSLPYNASMHANRSHGIAMTWVYHNIVKKIKPLTFTFIDHDMIPVKSNNHLHFLEKQAIYGLENQSRLA
jgi:hypothetical protein